MSSQPVHFAAWSLEPGGDARVMTRVFQMENRIKWGLKALWSLDKMFEMGLSLPDFFIWSMEVNSDRAQLSSRCAVL